MPFGTHTHRQDVVSKPRRLGPGRGERHVTLHLRFVLQRLHPGEAVGIGPDRVVDPAEVDVERAAALVEEVRQQDRHLVVSERELLGPLEVVPLVGVRRTDRVVRLELVHAVAGGTALGGDRTGEHVQEEETAGDLPTAHVAGAGGPPVVAGELRRVGADHCSDLADGVGVDAGLLLGGFGGVLGVLLEQRGPELRELDRFSGDPLLQVGLPVDPSLDELGVPVLGLDQQASDREQKERLGAGPRGQPVVGFGAGVREARIAGDDLGTVGLRLDDALRVRVEVVP